MADDADVENLIETLIEREQRLLSVHGSGGLSDAEHDELERTKVQLDRLWDLLRQRRGREEFGLDPDAASIRGESTVERYEQ